MNPGDGQLVHCVPISGAWLNRHGELAVPFYTAVFDLGIDALKVEIGIDEAYRRAYRRSTVALEAHLVITAPVPGAVEVMVHSRIADRDVKRLHVVQDMRLEGVSVATRESMTVSFDLEARRSCVFGDDIRERIDVLFDAQRSLAPYVGRAHLLGVAQAADAN